MAYTLLFKNTAVKSIERLSDKDKKKVASASALESLKTNPFSGKKLTGEYKNYHSLRVWPYRIIYTVIKKELVVLIVDVAHRQGAYT